MRTVTSFILKCVPLVSVAVRQVEESTSPCKAPQDLGREESIHRYCVRTTLDHKDRGLVLNFGAVCLFTLTPLRSSGQSSWLHNGDVL
jgi:hypothetical protein